MNKPNFKMGNRLRFLSKVVISALLFSAASCSGATQSKVVTSQEGSIKSIVTPYTIYDVETAQIGGSEVIIGSGYNGEVVCYDYNGKLLWQNLLSGFVNGDICTYDINSDGDDEVLCANSDGVLYALDSNGELLWKFSQNNVPLYSVTALKQNGEVVIATGGYDKNIYLLSPESTLLSTTPSSSYAKTIAWGEPKKLGYQSTANFLRRVKDKDGNDVLALHGVINANDSNGALYFFDIDSLSYQLKLQKSFTALGGRSKGSFAVNSFEGGADKIILGETAMGLTFVELDTESGKTQIFDAMKIRDKNSDGENYIDHFGYRIVQVETVPDAEKGYKFFTLAGSRVLLINPDLTLNNESDILINKFSYNDMCKNQDSNIILASAQSGGNCIHIIDLKNSSWKNELQALVPEGNISTILSDREVLGSEVDTFTKPEWERAPLDVNFMSENTSDKFVGTYLNKYPSVNMMGSKWFPDVESAESMKRDTMSNDHYRKARDKRRRYTKTSDQIVKAYSQLYKGTEGAAYWGGHGNDPFFFSVNTLKKIVKTPEAKGKTTIIIYPELEDASDDFKYVKSTLLSPLANLSKTEREANNTNLKLFIRTKNIFWHGSVYVEGVWDDLLSGKYSDVYVPALEETSSRTMEVSIASRLGIWSSGSVDSWGSRCARDNPSHDRLRQKSHQMLPNHFLRNMVYHISLGAQYIDNFGVDQKYMSILWDMIGKGLIYVPKREEIVSLSPVQIRMMAPDKEFLAEGIHGKWTIFYDEEKTPKRVPMAFDHMNATWTAAPINEWDYSYYAAGVKDRRTHFLAPFPNGIVMVAPATLSTPYRKNMEEYIHPLYKNITKSYFTDGKYYYQDGEKVLATDLYKTIEKDIEEGAKKLPLTVNGDKIAWVAAQSAPKHIRVTVIDGGYLDPAHRTAKVSFNAVKAASMRDLASGEIIEIDENGNASIEIEAGGFRFFDVELQEELK